MLSNFNILRRRLFLKKPLFITETRYRVAAALDDDTARLSIENDLYRKAVSEEEDRNTQLQKALQMSKSAFNCDSGDEAVKQDNDLIFCHESLFEAAITGLEQEFAKLYALCTEQERELEQLSAILSEQGKIALSLAAEEEHLIVELNNLETNSRIFDDLNWHLALKCADAQKEVTSIGRVRLHSVVFQISLDSGGKYPRINNLRLSHRPKGDLAWSEINAAWSQAAQLLMLLGSTLKFSSRNLRVAPLTTCAKIIELRTSDSIKGTNIVHNLGVDFDDLNHHKSVSRRRPKGIDNITAPIKVFNTLLHQLFDHTEELYGRDLSFDLDWIGTRDLSNIDVGDDCGWCIAVHEIASKMQWLSGNVTRISMR